MRLISVFLTIITVIESNNIIFDNLRVNVTSCQELIDLTKMNRHIASDTMYEIQHKCPMEEVAGQTRIKGITIQLTNHFAMGHIITEMYTLQYMMMNTVDSFFFPSSAYLKYQGSNLGITEWGVHFFRSIIAVTGQATRLFFPTDHLEWIVQNNTMAPAPYLDNYCLEDVIRKREPAPECTVCLERETANRYRDYVYSVYGLKNPPDSPSTNKRPAKVVTFVTRGNRYRAIRNTDHMIDMIKQHLQNTTAHIDVKYQMFNSESSHSFIEQVQLCQMSDVIVTPHGAFLSNIIHMRNTSLVVEVSKSEPKLNFRNTPPDQLHYGPWQMFQNIASDFGVHFYRQHADDFMFEWNAGTFEVTDTEIMEMAVVIEKYFHHSYPDYLSMRHLKRENGTQHLLKCSD